MDSTEFFNTHSRFTDPRLHARTFLCGVCGELNRAQTPSASGHTPTHCRKAMLLLSNEQSIAAAQLDAAERVSWMAEGGSVTKVGGKRQWRAK